MSFLKKIPPANEPPITPDAGFSLQEMLNKALFVAAEKGDSRACRSIIDQGADVMYKNKKGATPLHLAANAGHMDACVVLMFSGGLVSAKDHAGKTPRACAKESEKDGVAAFLASAEALFALDRPLTKAPEQVNFDEPPRSPNLRQASVGQKP